MQKQVRPIPEGYHTITPYLTVRGAEGVIAFLEKGFGARVLRCHRAPNGSVANAELRIGDSMVMVAEGRPGTEPAPAQLYLYVDDTDAWYRRAIEAGGTSLLEPVDQFYGDRNAGVNDPSGNSWWIATRKEELTDAQVEERMKAYRK
jgi:PhnB protein